MLPPSGISAHGSRQKPWCRATYGSADIMGYIARWTSCWRTRSASDYVFFGTNRYSTTWPGKHVWGAFYWCYPCSSVSNLFARCHDAVKSWAPLPVVRRRNAIPWNSLFGLTNVQAFIYCQAHARAGITFFKLVVRPCCLVIGSSRLDACSGRFSGCGRFTFELQSSIT